MTTTPARTSAPTLKKKNPLLRYSLQGQAAVLEERAVTQKPLLGTFLLLGQSTVLAAPPNAGKTLITIATLMEAVEQGRIKGENVFYVNADDSTQGVAEKVRVLEEYGVHMLAEGYQDFRTGLLGPALEEMIETASSFQFRGWTLPPRSAPPPRRRLTQPAPPGHAADAQQPRAATLPKPTATFRTSGHPTPADRRAPLCAPKRSAFHKETNHAQTEAVRGFGRRRRVRTRPQEDRLLR